MIVKSDLKNTTLNYDTLSMLLWERGTKKSQCVRLQTKGRLVSPQNTTRLQWLSNPTAENIGRLIS